MLIIGKNKTTLTIKTKSCQDYISIFLSTLVPNCPPKGSYVKDVREKSPINSQKETYIGVLQRQWAQSCDQMFQNVPRLKHSA